MEQQKVLWIVFSVTLFLLVVVTVGFIWFLPPDTSPLATGEGASKEEARIDSQGSVYDPIEWVREQEEVPGLVEAPAEDGSDDIFIVYGESDGSEEEARIASDTVSTKAGDVETGIQEILVATPRQERPAVVSAPMTTVRTTTPVAPATPKSVRVTQYWIQAGSYKSRSRAENASVMLSEKGWSARIISREVGAETYFRVRIGPYDNQGEAEKFLDWIKGIESFNSSYISQVYTTRMVN